MAASTTALDAARKQYEEVSDRVVREFARFRRDKASDMKKIILDYVNVQVFMIRLYVGGGGAVGCRGGWLAGARFVSFVFWSRLSLSVSRVVGGGDVLARSW